MLSWSPTYEVWLSVTLSLAILATTDLVVWLGRKIRRRAPVAGSLGQPEMHFIETPPTRRPSVSTFWEDERLLLRHQVAGRR
jgi:hypothetical protein